jgi:hypothetical protein
VTLLFLLYIEGNGFSAAIEIPAPGVEKVIPFSPTPFFDHFVSPQQIFGSFCKPSLVLKIFM